MRTDEEEVDALAAFDRANPRQAKPEMVTIPKAEYDALRGALEFYADPDIYFDEHPDSPQGDTIAQVDNGKMAHKALLDHPA